jgi:hypothetical protein
VQRAHQNGVMAIASLNRCMAWLRPRVAPALMIGGRLRLDGIIPLLERDELVPLEFICLPFIFWASLP